MDGRQGKFWRVAGWLVKLKSRTFEGGYVATMPTGGTGPFTVKVCYGEDASTCCEAAVNFPPCTLSGPSQLDPGGEGMYLPSRGMSGATVTVTGEMTRIRDLSGGTGVVVLYE